YRSDDDRGWHEHSAWNQAKAGHACSHWLLGWCFACYARLLERGCRATHERHDQLHQKHGTGRRGDVIDGRRRTVAGKRPCVCPEEEHSAASVTRNRSVDIGG